MEEVETQTVSVAVRHESYVDAAIAYHTSSENNTVPLDRCVPDHYSLLSQG